MDNIDRYDAEWFNKRCKEGIITLKERLELASQQKLEAPEAFRREIEARLKECLFTIRKYCCTESMLANAYGYLIVLAMLKDTTKEERDRYQEEYELIDRKYRQKLAIFRNFETGLGKE